MDNKTCLLCGKIFRSPANLQAHKRRKTPCLIRDITPENINNPLRCIHCNKIFANASNLSKHINKSCKVRLGKIKPIDVGVKNEVEIISLKVEDRHNKEKIHQMEDTIELLKNELEEMKRVTSALVPVINPQTIEGNNTNNITNAQNATNVTTNNINQTNNFTFCNFDAPNVDKIKLTQEDILCENITKMMCEKIYFNKSLPENHVIFVPNVKEKRLLVYKDGIWENHVHDSVQDVLGTIQDVIYRTTYKKIDTGGDLYDTDQQFELLLPGVQHNIRQYFMRNPGHKMTQDQVMDLLVQKRNVVKNALQDSKK